KLDFQYPGYLFCCTFELGLISLTERCQGRTYNPVVISSLLLGKPLGKFFEIVEDVQFTEIRICRLRRTVQVLLLSCLHAPPPPRVARTASVLPGSQPRAAALPGPPPPRCGQHLS